MNKEFIAQEIVSKIKEMNELKVGEKAVIWGPIKLHDKTGLYKDREKFLLITIDPIGINIDVSDDLIKIYSDGLLLLDHDIEKMYNMKLTQEDIQLLDQFEDPFTRKKIRERFPKIVKLYKYSKYSIGRLNKYYETDLRLVHSGRLYYVEVILKVDDENKIVERVTINVKALAIYLKNFNKMLHKLTGYTRYTI
ncbi:MAG: hypothetical protein QXT40_03615 [Candidatus Micrarchaeia archaeon]